MSKTALHSEEEWKQKLDPEAYRVLRKKGTELAFSGKYDEHFDAGTYFCHGCKTPLFSSGQKFNSGCGWPAFDDELEGANITKIRDISHGMIRTEIVCGTCGGHLGHVFKDGPTETGLRYCVNSVSLDFEEE